MDFGKYYQRIMEKSVLQELDGVPGCRVWQGGLKNGKYGVIKVKIDESERTITAHRVAYMIFTGNPYLDPHLDASHLCHNSLCVNANHISLEPNPVNSSRKSCKNEGRCFHHDGYLDCHLPPA